MTDTRPLVLKPESALIVKRSCAAFCQAVEGKFGCAPEFLGLDFTTGSSFGSNKVTIVPDKKYTKRLHGGVTLSVWKDDLTTHVAEAVVNAANKHLSHGGGLALALSQAGGPQIQQMSDQITKKNGPVPTGDAVLTPAGNLPCKYIIHAVGPYVSPDPSSKEIASASQMLEKAIWSIFKYTEYHNVQSVAIPAISSGLYNFPLDCCADIIVHTVCSFSKQRQAQKGPLEVRLVNNDDPSVREMLRACSQLLGPSDSQSGTTQIQSMSSAKSSAKSSLPSLELGRVTLHLKKGPIEEETADVIVNTIANDLNLTKGYISQAILEKAGNKIQEEIKKRASGLVPGGWILKTSGYKLNCTAVYHTVCTEKGVDPYANKVLHTVVTQCLERADSEGFSSISFPAIGTGHLGFKKEEVSQLMINALVQFAKKHQGRKMDVYFVIFPRDTEKYQAFEKEMDSIRLSLDQATAKRLGIHASKEASETPQIVFHSNSSEALREAKAWAERILHVPSEEFTIINNHVIQFGQEDHAKLMTLQTIFHVHITEFFRDGRCGITINGDPRNVSSAALKVEAMLCQAQENFAVAEESDLLHTVVWWQGFSGLEEPENNAALEKAYLADAREVQMNGKTFMTDFTKMQIENEKGRAQIERTCIFNHYSTLTKSKKFFYERTALDEKAYSKMVRENKNEVERWDLNIVKVEKIENHALKQVFELNEKRLPSSPKRLYQCVKAQYCELICRVGFQREYAPPEEQQYGAGIYFTKDVRRALTLWKDSEEEYIYIIVAQVLTGKSTFGSPQMIVPPPITADPLVTYNSVTNRLNDTYVIFNGQQALPEYIITYEKSKMTGV